MTQSGSGAIGQELTCVRRRHGVPDEVHMAIKAVQPALLDPPPDRPSGHSQAAELGVTHHSTLLCRKFRGPAVNARNDFHADTEGTWKQFRPLGRRK